MPGAAATAIHIAYGTLGETDEQIEARARDHQREVVDAWETYLTDPGEVPDPARAADARREAPQVARPRRPGG